MGLFTYRAHISYCEQEESRQGIGPPPKVNRVETFDEKLYRKFSEQPLIPIGCAATVYFLTSGIKAFRNRDPVRSQKMMKGRVMAQFATLVCFVGYVGTDNFDLRLAPMYQDVKKVEEYYASEAKNSESNEKEN